MLPSFRHYLKFVDLHTKFDNHGFTIKNGAAFKMSPQNREGCKSIDHTVMMLPQVTHSGKLGKYSPIFVLRMRTIELGT